MTDMSVTNTCASISLLGILFREHSRET